MAPDYLSLWSVDWFKCHVVARPLVTLGVRACGQIDQFIRRVDAVVYRHLDFRVALLNQESRRFSGLRSAIRALRLPIHLEQIPPDFRPLALARLFSLGLLSRPFLLAQFDYSSCHSVLLICTIAPYTSPAVIFRGDNFLDQIDNATAHLHVGNPNESIGQR